MLWPSPMELALGSDTSQGAESLIDSTPRDVQKVLSSRQWQPHPVGHTSWVLNHSIMWLVWPPWPQVRQKLDEPRTATWQMAHWKVKPLQRAHCVPRTSLRQWLQYTPNSAWEGGQKKTRSEKKRTLAHWGWEESRKKAKNTPRGEDCRIHPAGFFLIKETIEDFWCIEQAAAVPGLHAKGTLKAG